MLRTNTILVGWLMGVAVGSWGSCAHAQETASANAAAGLSIVAEQAAVPDGSGGASADRIARIVDRLERMPTQASANAGPTSPQQDREAAPLGVARSEAPDESDASPESDGQDPSLWPRRVAEEASQPLAPAGTFDGRGAGTSRFSTGGGWVLQTITALGVVIGVVLLIRWLYVRFGGVVVGGATPVVEVLSRNAVAPRSQVVLLRVAGRVLVVSESPAGMRTLAELTDPQEVADVLAAITASRADSHSRGFSQLLNGFGQEYDGRTSPADDAADRHELPIERARDSLSNLMSRIRLSGRGGGP